MEKGGNKERWYVSLLQGSGLDEQRRIVREAFAKESKKDQRSVWQLIIDRHARIIARHEQQRVEAQDALAELDA